MMLALSLTQRIWLIVVAAMLTVFVGISIFSTLHTREHLQEQINDQNSNATAVLAGERYSSCLMISNPR